jgi:hypothetical protein
MYLILRLGSPFRSWIAARDAHTGSAARDAHTGIAARKGSLR